MRYLQQPSTGFIEYFADLPDPRRDNGQLRHDLIDIVAIALCAVLCGAESFVEMEEFGQAKKLWLQSRLGLGLDHGIPSHDTFGRLFARLEPQAFGESFARWTQSLHTVTGGEVIALDGKSVRRSFDQACGQKALHLVSAWANSNRLVLAQERVDKKSNEITAVPALLAKLDISGCVVTTDALNTQKNIAAQIKQQKGDYVLALKGNHGLLHTGCYMRKCWSFSSGLISGPAACPRAVRVARKLSNGSTDDMRSDAATAYLPVNWTGPGRANSGRGCKAWSVSKPNAASMSSIPKFLCRLKPKPSVSVAST